jgi:hypothetical protein
MVHFLRVFLAIGLLASSAQAFGSVWGRVENGLRMSAAIAQNELGNNELEVTIENTTSQEILIVLGYMEYGFAETVHVVVKPQSGTEIAAFYLGSGGGLAHGRDLPMVLPLLPKSSYTCRTLLGGWGYRRTALHRVEELLTQESSLQVEFRNSAQQRVHYGILAAECYGSRPFWSGTLISNTLKLPLASPPKVTQAFARGRIVNDLCMSVTLVRNETRQHELDVSIRNTGLREYTLPIGELGSGHPAAIRFFIQMPNEASSSEVQWNVGGKGKQIQNVPLVLPMLPMSMYRFRAPLKSLRLPAYDRLSLEELLQQPSSLHAELSSSHKTHQSLDPMCYPVCLPPPPPPGHSAQHAPTGYQICWTGKLVSNKLSFSLPGVSPKH